MKRSPILCSVLLLVLAGMGGRAFAAPDDLEVGAEAPQILLPDLQGGTFDLKALQGEYKAVVVLFWGVWCPYCRELMVTLKNMYDELRQQGLQVIAVSMRESPHKVRLFVSKLKPDFPVLVDEWAELKDSYLIRDVPRVVIMNKDLIVEATKITTSVTTMQQMVAKAIE